MKSWHPFEVLLLSLGMLLAMQGIHILPGAFIVLAVTTSVALLTHSVSPSRWFLMLASSTGFLLLSLIVAPLSVRTHHGIWHSLYLDPALLQRAEEATLRSIASVSCTLLLLCSRSPVEWAAVVPSGTAWRFLADLLVLMERYFHLLRDSARSILVAQETRLSHVSRRKQIVSFAMMCSTLLARTEQRATNLQDALDARLYNGELVTRRTPVPLSIPRTALILALLCVTVAVGRSL